jgi:hypothetical protein
MVATTRYDKLLEEWNLGKAEAKAYFERLKNKDS